MFLDAIRFISTVRMRHGANLLTHERSLEVNEQTTSDATDRSGNPPYVDEAQDRNRKSQEETKAQKRYNAYPHQRMSGNATEHPQEYSTPSC